MTDAHTAEIDALPLWCRLRGHGWKRRAFWPGWERRTCSRCADLCVIPPEVGQSDE